MVTSLSHKLSIDGNASHGAWVRDLGTGQEFLDFSGDWPGHLAMVFVAILGLTLWMSCSSSRTKAALSVGAQPSFDCSLRDTTMAGFAPSTKL